jgi:hypothetical protein
VALVGREVGHGRLAGGEEVFGSREGGRGSWRWGVVYNFVKYNLICRRRYLFIFYFTE